LKFQVIKFPEDKNDENSERKLFLHSLDFCATKTHFQNIGLVEQLRKKS
jgi:hypothetical protein